MSGRWTGLLLAAVITLASSRVSADPVKIQRTVLANGMTVLVVVDHRIPFGAMSLQYGGGYWADARDKVGLSTITWAMAHDSTLHLGVGESSRLLSQAGAVRESSGCAQVGSYESVMVPSNRLALPMWIWSDSAGFFVQNMSQSSLDKQKELLRAKYDASIKNQPCGLCANFIEAELFPQGHPYHDARWASPDTLDNITMADVAAAHSRLFNPAQAVLAVSGAVEEQEVVRLARQYFEPIPSVSAPVAFPSIPVQLKGETRIHAVADIAVPRVMISWVTPGLYLENDASFDLLTKVLKGRGSSLLSWEFDHKNLAVETRARQNSRKKDSYFQISVELSSNSTVDQTIEEVDKIIDLLRKDYIRGSVFAMAQSESFLQFCREEQSAYGRATLLSSWFFSTGEVPGPAPRADAITRLTSFGVTRAVQRYLGADRVVLVVQPDPRAPRAGEVRSVVRGKQ